MYRHHPVFEYIKSIIKNKKYGKMNYVISNFRYPSKKKSNNRYKLKKEMVFFNDAASYLVSLETYLFDNLKIFYDLKPRKLKKK